MRTTFIILLSLLTLNCLSQDLPYQRMKTPYEFEYIKGSKKTFVPDTSETLLCADTNRVSVVGGKLLYSIKDTISGCAKWEVSGTLVKSLADSAILVGMDTIRLDSELKFDLDPVYLIQLGRDANILFRKFSLDSLLWNIYNTRQNKSSYLDSVRALLGRFEILRADTIFSNNIPNQEIPIFINGRMTSSSTVQNNFIGLRVRQRTAAQGFTGSDILYSITDTSGLGRFSVRWDGRTTIGTGTATNYIDVYGTQGGFNNTNIRIKTSATNGDAKFIAENSGSGRMALQVTSPLATVLANQGSIITENLSKLDFITDGNLISGGSAPIIFKSGGYNINPQLAVHPTNQFSINMGSTVPNAALIYDVGGTSRATRPWSQLTTAQMNAISSPPPGSVIYNTTENAVMTFDGTRWTGFRFNGTKFQGYESGSGTWVDLN